MLAMKMNREQKRNALKKGHMMHVADVDRLMRDTGYKMLKRAVHDYSAVVALTLKDELGFGHVRTKRVLQKIATMFDDIQQGRLSVDDVKQTLAEEIRVIIE